MAQIVVIVGSASDMEVVRRSGMFEMLREVGASFEVSVISAHRNPKELADYCEEALTGGTKVFIGVAGMAAAVPGERLPGICVRWLRNAWSSAFRCHLRSFQTRSMHSSQRCGCLKGIPVLVSGIGEAGLVNAAHAACQIVAVGDDAIALQLPAYMVTQGTPAQIRLETFTGRRE